MNKFITYFVVLLGFVSLTTAQAEENSMAVWSELVPYAEVKKELPNLKAHQLDLHLAVPESKINDPQLFEVLKRAEELEVTVRAWLLLPDHKGYWPSMHNSKSYVALVAKFLNTLQEQNLTVSWITLDMEPALGWGGIMSRFDSSQRPEPKSPDYHAKFDEATQDYADLVVDLNQQGIKAHVVTFPEVLTDWKDGKPKIQKHMGLPIQDIPWNHVSVMIYRPFYHLLNPLISPRIVYEYGKLLRRAFGDKTAVDLGPIGMGGKVVTPYGYRGAGSLKADIAAAKAAGIKRIHIFSLDGARQNGGLTPWVVEAEAKKPGFDINTTAYMGGITSFRALL